MPINKPRSLTFIYGLMGVLSISERCGIREINLAAGRIDQIWGKGFRELDPSGNRWDVRRCGLWPQGREQRTRQAPRSLCIFASRCGVAYGSAETLGFSFLSGPMWFLVQKGESAEHSSALTC